ALMDAQSSATIVTFIGSLNPYITANPAIGVAVPVAPLTNPAKAIIIPDVAPPRKFVTYTGIGLADMISTWDNGSIATEMVVFRSPNFIRWKNTKIIKDEPNTANAPIARGVPVNPNIAVKAIELSGAVATTVMTPPKIIPITIGLASVVCVIIPPILSSVASTSGSTSTANKRTSGDATIMATNKSRPSGTFVSIFLTKKDKR